MVERPKLNLDMTSDPAPSAPIQDPDRAWSSNLAIQWGWIVPVLLIGAFHLLTAYHLNVRKGEITDLTTFHWAAAEAIRGNNPYAIHELYWPFMYPPATLWFMGPVGRLGLPGAVVVWTLAQVAALVGAGFLFVSMNRSPGEEPDHRGPNPLIWLIPGLLSYRFIFRCARLGQVDMFLLFFLTLAAWALHRARPWLSGAALAVATGIKILPGIVVLVFLARRRWRALLAFSLSLGLWLVWPLIGFGPARGIQLLDQWRHSAIFSHATSLEYANDPANQSLSATMIRTLADRSPDPAQAGHPIAGLELKTVGQIWMTLSLALIGATFLILVKNRQSHGDEDVEFGLAILLYHLISRKTWETHLVTMFFIHAIWVQRSTQDPVARRTLGIPGLIAALLQVGYAPIFVGNLSTSIQYYGPTTLSLLILWTAFGCFLLRRRGDSP